MQSVSSRIWTCVAVSISYDDNHYTTGTSTLYSLKGEVENLVFDFNWLNDEIPWLEIKWFVELFSSL